MSETVRLQDPTAGPVPQTMDWTAYLAGDTITGSSWSIEPTGPTLGSPAFASPLTTVWVSGVVFGQLYRVINTITTAAGVHDARSFIIRGFSE